MLGRKSKEGKPGTKGPITDRRALFSKYLLPATLAVGTTSALDLLPSSVEASTRGYETLGKMSPEEQLTYLIRIYMQNTITLRGIVDGKERKDKEAEQIYKYLEQIRPHLHPFLMVSLPQLDFKIDKYRLPLDKKTLDEIQTTFNFLLAWTKKRPDLLKKIGITGKNESPRDIWFLSIWATNIGLFISRNSKNQNTNYEEKIRMAVEAIEKSRKRWFNYPFFKMDGVRQKTFFIAGNDKSKKTGQMFFGTERAQEKARQISDEYSFFRYGVTGYKPSLLEEIADRKNAKTKLSFIIDAHTNSKFISLTTTNTNTLEENISQEDLLQVFAERYKDADNIEFDKKYPPTFGIDSCQPEFWLEFVDRFEKKFGFSGPVIAASSEFGESTSVESTFLERYILENGKCTVGEFYTRFATFQSERTSKPILLLPGDDKSIKVVEVKEEDRKVI